MFLLAHKFANYALMRTQEVMGSKRVRGNPYYVVLDPTSYCQLDCPFCGREERPLAHLCIDEFRRILDSVGKTCINLELYCWGEPFLNKDTLEMIRYATGKYRIYTRVSSNLNLKKDDLYRDIVTSGLSELTISLDGASQETYEQYRVKGSFDAVIENIKLLVARKRELNMVEPRLVWQFLVFRHNEHEIEIAKKMAADLGVDEIAFRQPSIPQESSSWQSEFARTGTAATVAARPVAAEKPEPFPAASGTAVASDVSVAEMASPVPTAESSPPRPAATEDITRAVAKKRCNWPYSAVTINANGSVSPCCGIEKPEEDFGNVEIGFHKVWNNDAFQTARRFARSHEVAPHSDNTCGRCTFKGTINFSPSLVELFCFTMPRLRRYWLRRRGFRIKMQQTTGVPLPLQN